jgi:hypothetical protein
MELYFPDFVDKNLYESVIKLDQDKERFHCESICEMLPYFARPLSRHLWLLDKAGFDYKSRPLKVLEIGGGFYRSLLEFKKLNPLVEHTTITRNWEFTKIDIQNDESLLLKINELYNIFDPIELQSLKLALPLKYKLSDNISFIKSESIDLIISIYTWSLFTRQDSMFIDAIRTLKVGGACIIPRINIKYMDKLILYKDFLIENGFLVKDQFLFKTSCDMELPYLNHIEAEIFEVKK